MKFPKILIGSLLACATIAASSPAASATTDVKASDFAAIEERSFDTTNALQYWTQERLAKAAGADGNLPAPKMQIAAAPAKGIGENFGGYPSIGTFFIKGEKGDTHYCTGSVIDSPGKDLVLTAGHCLRDEMKKMVFVPKWSMVDGKPQTPLGIWPVEKAYKYDAYDNVNGTTPHLDLRILKIQRVNNKAIGQVAGAYPFLTDDAWRNRDAVQIIGYPDKTRGQAIKTQPRRCTNDIPTKGPKAAPVKRDFSSQIYCTSMIAGSSGGPWLDYINNRWVIVAITAGEENDKTGPARSDDDNTVGLKLGKGFRSLLAKAQAG